MSSTKVHSWHINIDVGDGAIHLLINEAATPKPQILKAVLIDAGLAKNVEAVTNAIVEIQKAYALPAGDTNLKFDSVIITHWDMYVKLRHQVHSPSEWDKSP